MVICENQIVICEDQMVMCKNQIVMCKLQMIVYNNQIPVYQYSCVRNFTISLNFFCFYHCCVALVLMDFCGTPLANRLRLVHGAESWNLP